MTVTDVPCGLRAVTVTVVPVVCTVMLSVEVCFGRVGLPLQSVSVDSLSLTRRRLHWGGSLGGAHAGGGGGGFVGV